ncbi:LuxR C-terminal-related transcriptional regulator, partial [Enterobacter roggenkampii]|uniref:LuxR C-terminal-related transcriptional regulator n=1 Tax=Enterobacter roggenkampii TaxID=1812935 RepID=UPI002005D986
RLGCQKACVLPENPASYRVVRTKSYLFNKAKEILNKLRIGASNIEIARSLFISENTVKTHLYNLFKKIAVKNRTQAVSWANDNLRR